MKKPIPLLLITGFLGAGKTTLINRFLREAVPGSSEAAPGRTGVLVNDFGRIPVDGTLLARKTDEEGRTQALIHEIGGGSIFCSCLKGAFILGLQHFVHLRPDLLVVESSGLSDPASFGKILRDHGLADAFDHCGTICLADPMRILQLSTVLPAVANQVTSADLVILNKIDLAGPEEIRRARDRIRELHPGAKVVETVGAEVDIPAHLASPAERRRAEEEVCQTPRERPASLHLPQKEVSRQKLLEFLNDLLPLVYRIKGFYRFGREILFVGDDGRRVTAEALAADQGIPGREELGITVLAAPEAGEEVSRRWREFLKAAPVKKASPASGLAGELSSVPLHDRR